MKKRFYLRQKSNQSMSEFEDLLGMSLIPVVPDPAFINNLQNQLLSQIRSLPAKSKPSTDQIVLFAAAGLLSGTMFLLLGIRSIIMILSALGLLSQYKKSIEKERIPGSQTMV